MTVRLFVGTDPEGRIWEPDYTHEAEAAIRIAGKIWRAFHASNELFLLAFNLHKPNIDLLILHERGIGLAECKAHQGKIEINSEDTWVAAGKPMLGYRLVPGREASAASYKNPHAQVQAHGRALFEKIMPLIREDYPDLTKGKRKAIRFQTTVCFTNPAAEISDLREMLPVWLKGRLETWESDFLVTTAEDIPNWVSLLRFEVKSLDEQPYYPFRLDPERMESLLTRLFSVERWETAEKRLPAVHYGSLVKIEGGHPVAVHTLWEEENVLGRDPAKSTIPVPSHHTRVSRVHAAIGRDTAGVWIKDLHSNNGTFINGKPIQGRMALADGVKITLGGLGESEKEAEYLFRTADLQGEGFETTENATRPFKRHAEETFPPKKKPVMGASDANVHPEQPVSAVTKPREGILREEE